MLRWAREPWSRNSAKCSRTFARREAPGRAAMSEGAAESRLGRLFSKNTAPCKLARGRIGCETWPLLEGQGEGFTPRTEALAKAGRNYKLTVVVT